MGARDVISNLRELATLTSTPDGAQRLAWGPVWRDAREWFKAKVAELGLRVDTDSAGNNWVTLPGNSPIPPCTRTSRRADCRSSSVF